jgi:hypothetical protein
MTAKKSMLLLFFSLFLINIAHAQEDFTASTLPDIGLCPCSNQAYPVTVHNTGSVESTYGLVAGGTAADWVIFSPDRFILGPGQSGNFFVFVDSICNIEGIFDLEIFVVTDAGAAKRINQNLNFSRCYEYSLERGAALEEADESVRYQQHQGPYSFCTNEHRSIPILITNNEDFDNRYRIVLDAPEWSELSAEAVELGPQESGIILVNINTPEVEGDFNFNLNAVSELGEVVRKTNLDIDVGQCSALELSLGKGEEDICSGQTTGYDLYVKNTGIIEQSIAIEAEGAPWIQVQDESLVLQAGEEKTVRIFALPEEDVSGKFKITFLATADDLEFSDTLDLRVTEAEACYKPDIDVKRRITNNYEEDFFSVKVTNKGIKKSTYSASLDGLTWATVSPLSLDLNPGQSGNLNINIYPPEEEEPGLHTLTINLESNNIIYSEEVSINLKKGSGLTRTFLSTLKFYQYYFYVLTFLIVLVIVFIKPIIMFKEKLSKKYEKHKTKKEKRHAAKLAKEQREREKKKKSEEKTEKKEIKAEAKPPKKKAKASKKSKVWLYSAAGLIAIVLAVLAGHFLRLFNAKYLHVYITNIFVGYLYYILIGVGVVVLLFSGLLMHNFLVKRKRKKAVKEKKTSTKGRLFLIVALTVVLLSALLAAIFYIDALSAVKDFFVLYANYFGIGLVILIIIIGVLAFNKPSVKFFKE